MLILALDTSSPVCALALAENERVLYEDDREAGQRHAEELLPRIEVALASAGRELAQVELIAVGIGPGSFTGLRVGVATAKGLSLGSGTPLRGVSSLQAVACGAGAGDGQVVAMLDAGKGEVCAAVYRQGQELIPAFRAEPEAAAQRLAAIGSALLCGTGARRHAQALLALLGPTVALADPALDYPRGCTLARLGHALWLREGPSDLATLEPVYLRGSDAKLPATEVA